MMRIDSSKCEYRQCTVRQPRRQNTFNSTVASLKINHKTQHYRKCHNNDNRALILPKMKPPVGWRVWTERPPRRRRKTSTLHLTSPGTKECHPTLHSAADAAATQTREKRLFQWNSESSPRASQSSAHRPRADHSDVSSVLLHAV